MAFVLSDKKLPVVKPLWVSLSYAYGIGLARGSYISSMLGFGPNYQLRWINHYFWECILIIVRRNYQIGKFLKDFIRQRIINLFEMNSIRGRRLFGGYPVRGQRTHSNARNAKALKPYPIALVTEPSKKSDNKKKSKDNKANAKSKNTKKRK